MSEKDSKQLQGEAAKGGQWKLTWKDTFLYSFLGILFVGQVVLCFLFYNWANLDVLLYMGWATLAASLILGMMSRAAFQTKGRAREGASWLQTTVVVDSRIYATVRHPMYLSFICLILALILIAQHWLSPIFGIPTIVFFYLSMTQEEQSNIQKFGNDYVAYMKRVPRMNLILGIVRVLRRQKHR